MVPTTCLPTIERKFVSRPDYDRAQKIFYEPGLLENNKFALNPMEGLVTSVNTESQPDRGETLKNLGTTATNFAGIWGAKPSDAIPAAPRACTGAPFLKAIFKYLSVEKFPVVG